MLVSIINCLKSSGPFYFTVTPERSCVSVVLTTSLCVSTGGQRLLPFTAVSVAESQSGDRLGLRSLLITVGPV